MPLHYQWFVQGRAVGERAVVELGHGDVYFMSNSIQFNILLQQ
jgi:hypothetical protein